MSYDLELADRLRAALSTVSGVRERRMFGGLAFLVDDALAIAVSGRGGLMVRCEPELATELVGTDGVERMVMQGREMAGWLRVPAETADDEASLARWAQIGRAAAGSA